jgi:hypothetical protein
MGTEFATITLNTDHIVPEQKLWRGVLFNALEDSMLNASDRKSSIYKTQAHNWIVNKTDDFEKICYWGGYDPDNVKEKYSEAVLKGDIKFNCKQIAWAKYYKQYLIYKKSKDVDSRKYHRKRLEWLRHEVKNSTTALISMIIISVIA